MTKSASHRSFDTSGGYVETKKLKQDEQLYLKLYNLGWVNNLDSGQCFLHTAEYALSAAVSRLVLSWQQCNEINPVPSTFLNYFNSLRSGG